MIKHEKSLFLMMVVKQKLCLFAFIKTGETPEYVCYKQTRPRLVKRIEVSSLNLFIDAFSSELNPMVFFLSFAIQKQFYSLLLY